MNLKIVFNDFDKEDAGHSDDACKLKLLKNAHMYFGCNLDEAGLKKEGDQGKVSISMPNGDEVKFTVVDFKPQAPKLEKTVGNDDGNGIVTWTVKYTNAVGAYDTEKLPNKLVDTLPEGLEYLESSASVTVGGTIGTINATNFSLTDGVITYTMPASIDDGKDVILTYKTKLSNKVMSDIWSKPNGENKYMNFAEAKKDDASLNPKLEAKKELVVPKDWTGRKMLSKNGTVSDDKRSIKWTVTVNSASRGFKYLRVINTMGKGLTLNPGTVEIDSDGTKATVTPTVIKTADNKTEMTVKLVNEGTTAQAAAKYVITYTTIIDLNYFDPNAVDKPSEADVSNSARLEYAWPDGKGPESPAMPPSIGKGPGDTGFSQELIKKEKVGEYDHATRKFTWKITVNPNKVNLTKAVVFDDLGGKDMLFVSNKEDTDELSKAKAVISSEITAAMNSANASAVLDSPSLTDSRLDFTITGLEKNTFSFNIETFASNPAFWAANVTNKDYLNEVVMKADDTTIGGTPLSEDKKGNAVNKVTHTVLEKSHTGYNAVDNVLTWKFVVNKDNVPLGDVNISDELPAGLAYVTGSAELITSPANVGVTLTDNSTENNVRLKINGINQAETIIFKTKVDVNTDEFKKKENVEFKNTAKMTSAANSAETSSNTSAAVINNNVMKKDLTSSGNKIDYVVEINPNGMKLNAAGELIFTDKLTEGLFFDSETFKLFEGKRRDNVSPNDGKYVYKLGAGDEITSSSYKLKENTADNSFTVTLPSTENASYIAKYSAYATKTGVELKNSVALGNSVLGGDENSKAAKSFTYNAGGGADLELPEDKFITIRVDNTYKDGDGTEKKMPAGVEFELFLDGVIIGKMITDNNGVAEATFPKGIYTGSSKGLRMRQITVPPNYNIINGIIDYDISENAIMSAVKGGVTVPVENKPDPGNPGGSTVPNPPAPSPPPSPPSYNWGSGSSSSVDEDENEVTEVVDVVINPNKPATPITDIPKTGFEDYLAAYIIIMMLAVFNGFVLIAKQVKQRQRNLNK